MAELLLLKAVETDRKGGRVGNVGTAFKRKERDN
jgi:hypothetical protein